MAAYDIRRKWQITLNEYLSPLVRLQCKFKKYTNILHTVTYSFLFNNHLNSYLVHIQCSLSLIKYFNNYQHSWQDLIKCFLESEEWSSQLIFQFKQLERRSLKKKSGLQRDSNPWPPRYRCDALPTELWSHTLGARSINWVHIFPWGVKWCEVYMK